jgi:hypothetical protein
MGYDVLGESRRLITNGLPDRPVGLTRRRRFAAVAVDVDGDVACTRFVRRGSGCFWDETHLLARGVAGWKLLGSSGSSGGELWSTDEFEHERSRLPAGRVEAQGGGGALRNPNRLLPWGARWVRGAELLAGPEVVGVVVDDRRRLTVPEHGRLVVVWASRRPPRVSACDVAGRTLTDVALPSGH